VRARVSRNILCLSHKSKLYNIISLFASDRVVTALTILEIDFPPNWITLVYVVGNFMIRLFLNIARNNIRVATGVDSVVRTYL